VAAAVASPDADALMGDVAGAARTVAWSSDDGWRRVASWLTGPGRRAGADRAVGPGLVLRDGEIALGPGADPGGDPSHALRAAVAAVEYGVGLSRQALDRLAAETPPPPDPWPESLRHSLVRLLDCGPPALATIEALDQKGLLVRLLPEWEFVRNRPQRNAYHRFTVDRHLLEAAAGAASLVRRVERPDLLIVGTLLHDIGKGRPGDHSQVGAELAVSISGRMGFTPADVGIIATLVSQHLLLADTAVRRDLDDPATVAMVAAAVGDAPTLELLAALTEADALATGPAAWGTWKEGLVRTLVARTASHLAGRPVTVPAPSEPTAEQRAMLAAGRLDLKATGERLTVVAPDRPGLLAVVAGVLALRGVDVLSATTGQGDNGMALLVFDVAPTYTDLPDWSQVRADVEAALDGRLALAERLAEQDATERRRRRRRAAATPRIEVGVHHGASAVATVVEVRAPDGPGVLSHIAAALAGAGLSIISARAGTYGAEVVDAFYVVGPDGAPLGPGARGDAAVAAVKAALAER
jgi:[protein-PII] uridylyltransferase